jgi:transposase
MTAYSQDLRERGVGACDEGRSTRPQIAELFGVSTAWIRRLLQRHRESGSIAALPQVIGSKRDSKCCGRLALSTGFVHDLRSLQTKEMDVP